MRKRGSEAGRNVSLIASPEWPVMDSSLTTLGTLGFQGWSNAIVFPEHFLKSTL